MQRGTRDFQDRGDWLSRPEQTYKPVSVLPRRSGAAAVIYLGRQLPDASSGLPEGEAGHLNALLFGLAPGGVFLANPVTGVAGGLLHHLFTLTHAGGMLSVALSVGSPRLGVTQHPALWSPDFPRAGSPPCPRPPGLLGPSTVY